jgi:hypothetical protein
MDKKKIIETIKEKASKVGSAIKNAYQEGEAYRNKKKEEKKESRKSERKWGGK